MRRHPWLVVALLALGGVMALASFPARATLDQRRREQALVVAVRTVEAANAALAVEAELLRTDAEIERLARERYQLVRPGEEAYSILPDEWTPPPSTLVPAAGPPNEPGWLSRAWSRLTSLF